MTIAYHQEAAIRRLTEEDRLRREVIEWIAAEFAWPPDNSIVRVGELASRLQRLVESGEELNPQTLAWALDTDGRYWGEALVGGSEGGYQSGTKQSTTQSNSEQEGTPEQG